MPDAKGQWYDHDERQDGIFSCRGSRKDDCCSPEDLGVGVVDIERLVHC